MSGTVVLASAGGVVLELVAVINANRAWLSEIDGAIGDGDHGVNMSKGFSRAGEALQAAQGDLGHGFTILGETLLDGIGGSMGPLYGTFFLDMASVVADEATLDAAMFGRMLRAGLAGVEDLGSAKLGDKTLLDTLIPAAEAFDAATASGAGLADGLAAMAEAAQAGRDRTKDLVARIGRAARLGERSRGTLDAGASSCCLILQTLAQGLTSRIVA